MIYGPCSGPPYDVISSTRYFIMHHAFHQGYLWLLSVVVTCGYCDKTCDWGKATHQSKFHYSGMFGAICTYLFLLEYIRLFDFITMNTCTQQTSVFVLLMYNLQAGFITTHIFTTAVEMLY